MARVSRKALMGFWTYEPSLKPLFEIREDSIYYVDHSVSYTYFLKRDTILIQYPDWNFRARVKLEKDHLEIVSENGLVKFRRLKKSQHEQGRNKRPSSIPPPIW
ncbi:MAG: hypothetical protein ACJ75B_12465 [Flavisolibacter sp.]